MSRACSRPDCGETAAATFTYDYQARTTWLDGLASESHPMAYDLCGAHADALTVPRVGASTHGGNRGELRRRMQCHMPRSSQTLVTGLNARRTDPRTGGASPRLCTTFDLADACQRQR
ncbi:MAG: DUF3499 family protein [Acidimicrobiales bacterium]